MNNLMLETLALLAERDRILKLCDWREFKRFWQNNYPRRQWPDKDLVYEIIMHKGRCVISTMTEEEREYSRKWLTSRGYHAPEDDVDLMRHSQMAREVMSVRRR